MTGPAPALRVLRGDPSPEELAAVVVALLALARTRTAPADPAPAPTPLWPVPADAGPSTVSWAGRSPLGWAA
ncbi:acyl-CoA carboxylase epsilon subunit [Kitasatospora azatica]|uniref:acyl-CoA carboxylase epsilon subunit n=1 Tax=Kitasatospora azatica TaxID=58347 RepID=UPI0005657462|nr:acyl-CoA carboxylase epsilon subunit [Kitasatospora azatica]